MDMVEIEQDDFGTLAVCALRYCHGRRTYMPKLVQSIIIDNLDKLTTKDLSVIVQDEQFMSATDYGDEKIDKPNWESFYRKVKDEYYGRKCGVEWY